jgi:type 1 glutamine amidotransferase
VVRGGWEGHAPVEITGLFLPYLKEQGFTVEVSDSLDVYADAALLAGTDLVVQCWSMGEITAEQSRGLSAAVRAGTGFAGWHGGVVDAFRGDLDYAQMTGGQFLMHPPGFADYTVNMVPREHPVTAGLSDFAVHTEHYWMFTDPAIDVLATSVFPAADAPDRAFDVVMPQVWTRRHGAGRVFVSALGHKTDDFDVPEVRTLTERGLLWASR